jgi:hypothetical protein
MTLVSMSRPYGCRAWSTSAETTILAIIQMLYARVWPAGTGSARRIHETGLVGQYGRLDTAVEVQLGEHPGHVRLGRQLRDVQPRRDLPVRQSGRDQFEHLHLTRGQCVEGDGPWPRSRAHPRSDQVVDQAPGRHRRDDRSTGRRGTDSLEQLDGWRVLDQEAGRTRLQCVEGVVVGVERGQDEHLGWVRQRPDRRGRRDALHARHADVHEHHVKMRAARDLDRRGAVTGLGDDIDVGLGVQQRAEARTHQHLVVDHRDPDHRVSGTGNDASTVSSPDCTLVCRVPSYSVTRSAMPRRP